MTRARFFDWFQFGIFLCWGTLGLARALLFRARGVRVIVSDRQRTIGEMLSDGLAVVCLLLWVYEVVAHAWSFDHLFGTAVSGRILGDGVLLPIAGALVSVTAVLLYGIALRHLGSSWRLGIDRTAPGPLVTRGVYRWTRHPIYVAFGLLFIGTFLVHGHLVFLLLVLVWLPVLHLLMRREERFLIQRYGSAYRDYCSRVGRYLTWPKNEHKTNEQFGTTK